MRPLRLRRLPSCLALLVLTGCEAPTPEPDAPPPPPPEAWDLGPERICDAPVDGIQLTEQAFLRGVTPDTANDDGPFGEERWVVTTVAAADADDDGDVDLIFGSGSDRPQVYGNDGEGFFSAVEAPALASAPFPPALALVDLTDDRLPELAVFDGEALRVATNQGDLRWGPFEDVWTATGPAVTAASLAFGDVDGDGDLDLWLPGMHTFDRENPMDGGPSADRLLLNHGGSFELAGEYLRSGELGLSFLAGFTDRDGDGDQDILAISDQPSDSSPTGFWRNDGLVDGLPALVDDGPDVGANLDISGMGLASADLNGDDRLDYCITDSGPVVCLLSEGDVYVEGAASLGLTEPEVVERGWVGWGIQFVDLDADGHPEVPVGAAPPDESNIYDDLFAQQPNALFVGSPDGFEERGAELGYDHDDFYFGVAAADLTGDGFPDLVTVGPGSNTLVHVPDCTGGAWVEVELVGPSGNPRGWGAQVRVDDHVREVVGPRGFAQGSGVVHVGLGTADQANVRIDWPDGATSESVVPVRRRVTVRHPEVL